MLVVAASGNAGDRPYVTATGGAARYAISVAQTQVPSASLQLLQVAGVDYRAVFQAVVRTARQITSLPDLFSMEMDKVGILTDVLTLHLGLLPERLSLLIGEVATLLSRLARSLLEVGWLVLLD